MKISDEYYKRCIIAYSSSSSNCILYFASGLFIPFGLQRPVDACLSSDHIASLVRLFVDQLTLLALRFRSSLHWNFFIILESFLRRLYMFWNWFIHRFVGWLILSSWKFYFLIWFCIVFEKFRVISNRMFLQGFIFIFFEFRTGSLLVNTYTIVS